MLVNVCVCECKACDFAKTNNNKKERKRSRGKCSMKFYRIFAAHFVLLLTAFSFHCERTTEEEDVI
jgi:hypothetical protein